MNKTINVLCPGPSLAKYERGPDCTLTIGVNRATLHQPCDWWLNKVAILLRKDDAG